MCQERGHVRGKRTRRARYQGDAEPDTGAGAMRRGAKRRCRRDSGDREGGTMRDPGGLWSASCKACARGDMAQATTGADLLRMKARRAASSALK